MRLKPKINNKVLRNNNSIILRKQGKYYLEKYTIDRGGSKSTHSLL